MAGQSVARGGALLGIDRRGIIAAHDATSPSGGSERLARLRTVLIIAIVLPGETRPGWLAFRVITSGGGASKSQPRPTIAGPPIYLGERKPTVPTCRDEIVAALHALSANGASDETETISVADVHGQMHNSGTAYPERTVRRAMSRMTSESIRPPHLRLESVGRGIYRVVAW